MIKSHVKEKRICQTTAGTLWYKKNKAKNKGKRHDKTRNQQEITTERNLP
jgi:hypothetical protein